MSSHASSMLSERSGAPSCWICGEPAVVSWKARELVRRLQPEDLRITDSRYGLTLELRRCAHCGFIFAEGPELEELTALYSGLDDEAYVGTQDARVWQMRWLLRRLLARAPWAKTLLDVGAGAGLLVVEARRLGLEATGIEPSHALVATAGRLHNVEIIQGTLPHAALGQRRFDLITLIDVIEHVSHPVQLLRTCGDYLSDRGLLAVVTPDVGSLAARLVGHRWWHFRLAHVGYFSRHTFALAAAAAGLEILEQTRPWWFFPVSYLTDRLAHYLPLTRINGLARRTRAGRWLFDRVIPLNLGDSLLFVLRRSS